MSKSQHSFLKRQVGIRKELRTLAKSLSFGAEGPRLRDRSSIMGVVVAAVVFVLQFGLRGRTFVLPLNGSKR